MIGPSGEAVTNSFDLAASGGQLLLTMDGVAGAKLAFYRPDHVLLLGPAGEPTSTRADFIRDRSGRVVWLRLGGRLAARGPFGTRSTAPSPSSASTGPPRFDWRWPWATTIPHR